jgi:hypothetical protein
MDDVRAQWSASHSGKTWCGCRILSPGVTGAIVCGRYTSPWGTLCEQQIAGICDKIVLGPANQAEA